MVLAGTIRGTRTVYIDNSMEKAHSDIPVGRGQPDHRKGVSAVSLKGGVFTLPVLKIQQADLVAIERDLRVHLTSAPGFFKDSPVILDLGSVPDWQIEFTALRALLAGLDLIVVAVQAASEQQSIRARRAGLGLMPIPTKSAPHKPESPKPVTALERRPVVEKVDIAPVASVAMQSVETEVDDSTLVMQQPIRSGQRLYARGGDLIQLAAVNAGAEIMADGNIHIYAPLRGRALAGVNGNEETRIFCHSMEAELIAIAGNYRVFEDNVPKEWYKKSVQIFLQNGQLIIRTIG
jgi:septum site-determining protein MinC